MTERLYYRDSLLLEFNATITEQGQHQEQHYTVLDRSAFYPTSGGQMHDTGTLNGVAVSDVIESESGQVWHLSSDPVGRLGETVHGVVDEHRRRLHCRMHTAQHLISQAFVQLQDTATVSVHLGVEYAAVELDVDRMSAQQLTAAELKTRRVIDSNYPVEIMFVDAEQAKQLPLRRVPQRTGSLRIIRIGEFDWSACGGTHCRSTAEIGALKIIGVEKIRGRSMVKFLAGQQALTDYDERFLVTDRMSRQLTCHVKDLPDRLEKQAGENSDLRKEITRLHKELLPYQVEQLAAQQEMCGPWPLVCCELTASDNRSAPQLAAQVAERVEGLAMLLTDDRLLIAVSPACRLDAGDLTRQLCRQAGLKGGGNRQLAQAGGVHQQKLSRYRDILREILPDA
ncbi:MAG: DHHA1 domain-containing protein [bacterium]